MSHFVLAVVLVVAAFDAIVGVWLLFGARPFEANGPGTLWSRDGAAAWERAPALIESLYRRLGAFSFHTGVATAVWAILSRDDPQRMLALLVTYTLTGLAFFANDRKFFAGTRYFVVKQALGALWTAALIAQIALMT